MEAEHNAREQEMLNGMQRDYDSGFMKAIMELESDIGISGIYNIVVSPLRYAYQGSSDPYGEAIRNRRQNSQNFYVGVAQFGFDIVDPITHPELITGRIYSGMFAVTNDPGILFQDQMGPALDAWDAVWADDDKTHFNKTGYLFGQILAAVGLGCAKSCIDEGLANTTTRTGAIEDRKGTVYGVAESGLNSNLLDELANSGVKYNPEDIVAITKTADGKLVWLENGTDTAGLNHIITEHADDFLNKGITQEQIPDYVMNALENGKIVGYQGRGTGRPIYEFTYNGEIHKVAITVGNNGFIVGANPK